MEHTLSDLAAIFQVNMC